MFSLTQNFGLRWERWAAARLTQLGYHTHLVSGFFAHVDIMADGCPVEVKASQPKKQFTGKIWRQRWQWDCARLPDFDHLVVLIALADDGPYPFVLPSWVLAGRGTTTPCLTSHPARYRGWLAQYRDNWQSLDHVAAVRARRVGLQMALPLGVELC